MKTVELVVENPQGIVARYFPNGRLGGLAVEGQSPVGAGVAVLLVVRVQDPPRLFRLRGRVAWARFVDGRAKGPGFGVEFQPSEKPARDRLIAFATGASQASTVRAHDRLSASLKVKLVLDGRLLAERASDVSAGGLFLPILVADMPSVGDELTATLRPPLSLRALRLGGRVAWRREHGEQRGIGVEFLFRGAREMARMESLVRRVSGRQRAKE